MARGRPDEAANEVAEAGDVLFVVRYAEAVIYRQDRVGPDTPLADEQHPQAAADLRARLERQGYLGGLRQMTRHSSVLNRPLLKK
jgi:hypothetical protein